MLQRTPVAEPVLLVAVCVGHRCLALRRLAAGPATEPVEPVEPGACDREAYPSEMVLRRAVRGRPDAVLVSVPCPGDCRHACWAAVGPGLAGPDSTVRWVRRPTVLALTETDANARAVANWIEAGAPDPATLPDDLRLGRA